MGPGSCECVKCVGMCQTHTKGCGLRTSRVQRTEMTIASTGWWQRVDYYVHSAEKQPKMCDLCRDIV